MKAAPVARRIFDHQCKTTFATQSAQSGRAVPLRSCPLSAVKEPRPSSIGAAANDPKRISRVHCSTHVGLIDCSRSLVKTPDRISERPPPSEWPLGHYQIVNRIRPTWRISAGMWLRSTTRGDDGKAVTRGLVSPADSARRTHASGDGP